SENCNSISFACLAPRSGKGRAHVVEGANHFGRHAIAEELGMHPRGSRTARPVECGDSPAIDTRSNRTDDAGNVLVGQHSEHGRRLRMKSHRSESSGEYTRSMRIVRDVEHDRRAPRKRLEASRKFHVNEAIADGAGAP